jgi:heme/copper-type cytochrome/quinol oxidase subunit 2
METPENIKNETLSIGDWLITMIVSAIPLVGIIMLFVWSFSSSTHPTKANWAKATLILIAIVIVLYIIFFAVFGAAFLGMMDQDLMNTQEY